jgi:hypothetical protein
MWTGDGAHFVSDTGCTRGGCQHRPQWHTRAFNTHSLAHDFEACVWQAASGSHGWGFLVWPPLCLWSWSPRALSIHSAASLCVLDIIIRPTGSAQDKELGTCTATRRAPRFTCRRVSEKQDASWWRNRRAFQHTATASQQRHYKVQPGSFRDEEGAIRRWLFGPWPMGVQGCDVMLCNLHGGRHVGGGEGAPGPWTIPHIIPDCRVQSYQCLTGERVTVHGHEPAPLRLPARAACGLSSASSCHEAGTHCRRRSMRGLSRAHHKGKARPC